MMTNNDGKNLPPSLLVTKGVNKFGSLLFKDLEKSKNLVFSPFSLSTALAMLTPGAKEKTLAQVVPSCFQELPTLKTSQELRMLLSVLFIVRSLCFDVLCQKCQQFHNFYRIVIWRCSLNVCNPLCLCIFLSHCLFVVQVQSFTMSHCHTQAWQIYLCKENWQSGENFRPKHKVLYFWG